MSSNIKVRRVCVYCGAEFMAQTTKTRYCSKKCNTAHYKAKIKAQKVEQSNIETTKITSKPIQEIQAKEFLTVKDVSILLGCSKRSVYRLIQNGTLEAVNLSERMTRVSKSEVNRLLKHTIPQPVVKEPKTVYTIKKPKQIEFNIEDCYTLTEVQNKYGISETALQNIIRTNEIPKLKQGWYAYVPKTLIDQILKT